MFSFDKKVFYSIIPSLILISCGPSLHVFNSANAPCLSKPLETKGNVYIGNDHSEFQLAFSPANHFGFMANYYSAYPSSQSKRTKLIEGAAGYYLPLTDEWNFDAYVGGGYGERAFNGIPEANGISNNQNTYHIQTYYGKFYIQPCVFLKRPKFEFGFSLQAAWYNFSNVHYYVLKPASDKYPYDQTFTFNYSNTPLININPALTFKFGFRNVKFISQVASNMRPTNPFYSNITTIGQTPFNSRLIELNFGIQFSFEGIEPK